MSSCRWAGPDLRRWSALSGLAGRDGLGDLLPAFALCVPAFAIHSPRRGAMVSHLANGSDRLGGLRLPHPNPVRRLAWLGGGVLLPNPIVPDLVELLLGAWRRAVRGSVRIDLRLVHGIHCLDLVDRRRARPQRAV